MDVQVPCPKDHSCVLVLVKLFQPNNYAEENVTEKQFPFNFKRIFDRLKRIEQILVSENPRRIMIPRFVTNFDADRAAWGEFQAYRKVLGLIFVAELSPSGESVPASVESVKNDYEKSKNEWKSTLFDSRCVIIGSENAGIIDLSEQEVLAYQDMENSQDLEGDVREFLKSLFWVLEGKRLDLSFEKQETPVCPIITEEEKYRVGLENKTSKLYRKKCIGRLRKQVADYTLMTGLPTLALDAYSSAIDLLKSSNDWLWLAGANEGWGCAAIAAKYQEKRKKSLQRVPTFTSGEMKTNREYSTEDSYHLIDYVEAGPVSNVVRSSVNPGEILEKFRLALENYEKFSFAALMECECVFKASNIFRLEMEYAEMEAFLREHTGKYLDGSFTQFHYNYKAYVCQALATVFRKVNFQRKSAFFLRLAALFKLHIGEEGPRDEQDYKQVYPLLFGALEGYKVASNIKHFPAGPLKGWASVQIRALHEVYISAVRAGYRDAAVRHLCYLLQAFLEDIDGGMVHQLCNELTDLCRNEEGRFIHPAHTHIQLPGSIVLPPVPMWKFPKVLSFEVLPLPDHLAPKIIQREESQSIFIYTPFGKSNLKDSVNWVVGCPAAVALKVMNLLPFELQIENLSVQSEGVQFDASPLHLTLPPAPSASVTMNLVGIPKTPGELIVAGYSCEVLSIKNVCRLRDVPWLLQSTSKSGGVRVSVLPPLPTLEIRSSLPRADPIELNEEEEGDGPAKGVQLTTAEVTVYSGQSFEHIITLENLSETETIHAIQLEIKQPPVRGGPSLIELTANIEQEDIRHPMPPRSRRDLGFRIYGLDPATVEEDQFEQYPVIPDALSMITDLTETTILTGNMGTVVSTGKLSTCSAGSAKRPSSGDTHSSGGTTTASGGAGKIPYLGRLLSASFLFRCNGGVSESGKEYYERTTTLSLYISIIPAVTVSEWQVLPGDDPKTRYLAVDVTNNTECESELIYGEKQISVQPKDICRVPILVPLCESGWTRMKDASDRRAWIAECDERERTRRNVETHIAQHLDIRWQIPSMDLSGFVPVGTLLASDELLRQMVLPPLSVGIRVNGAPYHGENGGKTGELEFRIGEIVALTLDLNNSLTDREFSGDLSLECYQDLQNPAHPLLKRSDHVIFVGPVLKPFTVASAKHNIITDDNTSRDLNDDIKNIDENDKKLDIGDDKQSSSSAELNNDEEGDEVLLTTESNLNEEEEKQECGKNKFSVTFRFLFCFEGTYKLRPVCKFQNKEARDISGFDSFFPVLTFNSVTR